MTPLPLRAYGLATRLLGPLVFVRIARRLAAQGVAQDRLAERRGIAARPRPSGRLIWFHAASVGESLSILPLLARLAAPGLTCLVTTGTATSAAMLPARLPAHALHQFAPLDCAPYIGRFLRHWRPDLAVFVESEVWPETLRLLDADGVPRVLLNARLSARSLARWARWPATARALFGGFAAIFAQTPAMRDALAALGCAQDRLQIGGNMKAASGAPPADPGTLAGLAALLQARPVWAAISTHEGEEAAALAAHRQVLDRHPGACLILCPRHPDRAAAVGALIRQTGLPFTQRSQAGDPTTPIYLADTMGETGLWFRLAPVVFLGGSLVEMGGHNPWEPAACGAALLTGPHLSNVAQDMDSLTRAGATRIIADAAALGPAVADLLADPAAARRMGAAGMAKQRASAMPVERIGAVLRALLPG